MKSRHCLCLCAFALSLLPTFASADEPSLTEWTKRRVDEGLIKPLAEADGNTRKFSRVRQPPRERRVRVTQPTAAVDKGGHKFATFVVDVRFGNGEWRENDIVGCAYVGSGKLFVRSGDAYYPAALLLGKDVEPVPGVCEPAPAARA